MRRLWIQIHLWLGLTLGVVGILIGISGSILVYDHEFDALINPRRYAVSGSRASLEFAEYAEHARQSVPGEGRVLNIRLPEVEGLPVVALVRGKEGTQFSRVYLDPPTGRVLDAAPGGGFIGWLHRFHENLTLREYWGREVVGLVGIAMLISSLSGIYLWWPVRGRLREALGPRPGLTGSRNLHYLFGFYGALLLALLSFSGIWLAYVDAGRAVVAAVSPLSPLPRNIRAPEPPAGAKAIAPDAVVSAARALYPDAKVIGLGMPAGPRGTYRVNLEGPDGAISVFLDPASGSLLQRLDPAGRSGGDRFLALQRSLHTGDTFGAARFLLFLAGLLPGVLAVTGTLMWLSKRKRAS